MPQPRNKAYIFFVNQDDCPVDIPRHDIQHRQRVIQPPSCKPKCKHHWRLHPGESLFKVRRRLLGHITQLRAKCGTGLCGQTVQITYDGGRGDRGRQKVVCTAIDAYKGRNMGENRRNRIFCN